MDPESPVRGEEEGQHSIMTREHEMSLSVSGLLMTVKRVNYSCSTNL